MDSYSSLPTRDFKRYDIYEAGSHGDSSPREIEPNQPTVQQVKITQDEIINVQFTIENDYEKTEVILSRMEEVLEEGDPTDQGAILYSLVTSYNRLQIEIAQQIKLQIQENLTRKNALMNQLVEKINYFDISGYFMKANLTGRKMQFFDISNFKMNLIEANFDYCDLYSANLSNADMSRGKFNGTKLENTYFKSSKLPISILTNSTLKYSRSVINEELIQFVNEEGIFFHPCFESDENQSEQVNVIKPQKAERTVKCGGCTLF
jgi:uncharacterized protein YjbI with pentapeptide repeats